MNTDTDTQTTLRATEHYGQDADQDMIEFLVRDEQAAVAWTMRKG